MVVVKPFRGITYNKNKFSNIDKIVSPPYDIVDKSMQNKLYSNNEYNFIRLTLGRKTKFDNEKNNCYTRSKKYLDKWISQNILIESKRESIYPYKIYYNIKNQKKIMNGFFILLKIDKKYKKIRAHEKTLSKPKEDRLNLIRSCNANLEPIQLLYIDEEDEINKKINNKLKTPLFEIKAYDSFKHKLWKVNDNKIIKEIEKILKNKILFIADGHHRYQTAINYLNEMNKKYNNYDVDSPYSYRMVILANMFDEGLTILPTHRLVKKDDIDIKIILSKLKKYFNVIEKDLTDNNIKRVENTIINDISNNNKKQFALYIKNKYYILSLKSLNFMDNIVDNHSDIWKSLDVSILQKLIFEKIFDINQENIEKYIFYTRDCKDAIQFVNEGKYNLSFILNPTKITELKKIAEAGEHMPQKSTFFLPKMLSGLVIYKMNQ